MSIFPCSSTGLRRPASLGPSSVRNASAMSRRNWEKLICGITGLRFEYRGIEPLVWMELEGDQSRDKREIYLLNA